MKNKQIEIFQSEDGQAQVEVHFEQDTACLSQTQMVELFEKNKRTVSEHIRNIFKESELQEETVVRKFRTTTADGKSNVQNMRIANSYNSGELYQLATTEESSVVRLGQDNLRLSQARVLIESGTTIRNFRIVRPKDSRKVQCELKGCLIT